MKKSKNKNKTIRYEDGTSVVLGADDASELTAAFFKRARPATEVLEKLFGKKNTEALLSEKAKIRAVGRPRSKSPKEQITFRLGAEVTQAIRASGAGYNARVEAVLREAFIGE